MESPEHRYMDIEEFVSEGFLQEANRLFFHPLGLALEVTGDEITGVWDCRDDIEGVVFDPAPDKKKADRVAKERRRHAAARRAMMGSIKQPLNWTDQ